MGPVSSVFALPPMPKQGRGSILAQKRALGLHWTHEW
jgi:hypothetical protein